MAFRHGTWGCPCGFCRSFAADHPWDLPAARAWGATQPVATVDADDLRPAGGLFAALPLLSEPQGGAMRALVTNTRMGHNHWVLQSLCRRLDRATDLPADVGRLVDEYRAASRSPVAGDAVRVAYDLVTAGRSG
jgi:hypothetical protein